jgi:hypothetical protein
VSGLICGRCPASGMPTRVQGMNVDPPGWSNVTITGRPIVNRLLCPACTNDVRALLHTSPAVVEREREVGLEQAFSRGYDEGRVDALAAPTAVPAG